MITLLAATPLLLTAAKHIAVESHVRRSGNPLITISVDSGPRQTFAGMGASIVGQTSTGWTTPVTKRQMEEQARQIWGANHFTSTRIWLDPRVFEPKWGTTNIKDYVTGYAETDRLPSTMRAGAKDLLLAPGAIPAYMDDGTGHIADSWLPKYAYLLADFIFQFKKHTNWLINWTGILNEPGSGKDTNFRLNQWPTIIREVRKALDARGLRTVKILGPETSNCDNTALAIVQTIASDPIAWSNLDAVATHSYNMCGIPQMQAALRGKPWWITESGSLTDQDEKPGDALQGAVAAGRFLNDMNNGVTNWQYFLGAGIKRPQNSGKMMYFTASPYQVTVLQKYYYLRQLNETFDVGAVFRHCKSSLDGPMNWSYGKKAHVTSTVAKNPDGSFGIGITNFTSNIFLDPVGSGWLEDASQAQWIRTQFGFAAQAYSVNIVVPELASIPSLTFRAYRTNSFVNNVPIGTFTMVKGQINIPDVKPLDLITLRSPTKA